MSIRIISGDRRIIDSGAALYDSTSGWAFGPVFTNADAAERFLKWMDDNGHDDARTLRDRDLERLYGEWVDQDDEEPA